MESFAAVGKIWLKLESLNELGNLSIKMESVTAESGPKWTFLKVDDSERFFELNWTVKGHSRRSFDLKWTVPRDKSKCRSERSKRVKMDDPKMSKWTVYISNPKSESNINIQWRIGQPISDRHFQNLSQ